jgi:hypothetical protein
MPTAVPPEGILDRIVAAPQDGLVMGLLLLLAVMGVALVLLMRSAPIARLRLRCPVRRTMARLVVRLDPASGRADVIRCSVAGRDPLTCTRECLPLARA